MKKRVQTNRRQLPVRWKLLLISSLTVIALLLTVTNCNLDSNPVSLPVESADGTPTRAIATGQSRYLGSILGPANQDAGDYSLFIPDVHGDHRFTDYWNQVTGENDHKWGYLQTSRNEFNEGTVQAALAIYEYAKNNNIPFKFHTLIWGRPDQDQDTWRASVPQSEMPMVVEEWFRWVNTNFPDMEYIDVVNEPLTEPLSFANAFSGLVPGYRGPAQYEWIVWCFQKAREIFPASTQLLINEYQIINGQRTDAYIDIIQALLDHPYNGRRIIDGVGMQSHYFNVSQHGGEVPGRIESVLDRVAALGLPIHISELDINLQNEEAQRAELERVFRIFWNHPAVAGVTYWGYRWGRNWAPYTGLREDSGYERSALGWLRDYVRGTSPPPPSDPTPPPTDPTPPPTDPTPPPSQPDPAIDAYSRIMAVDYSAMLGIQTEASSEGGRNVGWIENNDWIRFDNVDFGSGPLSGIEARVASNTSGGRIEVRLNSPSGTLLGTMTVAGTGGWQNWTTRSASLSATTGTQNVYLVFRGGSGYLFNIRWLQFTRGTAAPPPTDPTPPPTDPTPPPTDPTPPPTTPGAVCDNPQPATSPYTHDGVINSCIRVTSIPGYINSWNMAEVTINGVDFTNSWASGSNMPARINGYYYIRLTGNYPWSHFEIR